MNSLRYIFKRRRGPRDSLITSRLFDERTFYDSFLNDLEKVSKTVIIESPFITNRRMQTLYPVLRKLIRRGVSVTINTRDPAEHEEYLCLQSERAIANLQRMGVQVLFTGSHHRKLAILDEKIIWEGSLNILSQYKSCEIMRRIYSEQLAEQMVGFLRLQSFGEG